MANLMWEQVAQIVKEDTYTHEHEVGEVLFTPCPDCGERSMVCIDKRERGWGVHRWLFGCETCGYEDMEQW